MNMRRVHIARISAIALLVIACLLSSHSSCYAALGVDPESIELVASPDTATNGVYNVVNEGSESVRVAVQPEEWPRSATPKGDLSIDKWLTVTPMEFDLAPQERKEVQFTINPPNGRGGELSAMIFFATTSPEGTMNITTRNGVSLYAAFADVMRLECSIAGVDVSKFEQKTDNGIVDRGIVFTINIENKSNVHIRPTGSIVITGEDGSSHNLNIERGFPTYIGGKGSYQVLWDKKDVTQGKYEALITLDYGQLYKMDKKTEKKMGFVVNKDGTVS
jgi:P pilus assembly chaperone PapD